MYDYNLTEYDILEMTDEDYLSYCNENCRRKKKLAIFDLFLFIVVFIYCAYSYSKGCFEQCIVLGFCLGLYFASIVDCYYEIKRWKREIIRFMKFEYDEDSFRLSKREKILNFLKEVGHINDNSDNN